MGHCSILNADGRARAGCRRAAQNCIATSLAALQPCAIEYPFLSEDIRTLIGDPRSFECFRSNGRPCRTCRTHAYLPTFCRHHKYEFHNGCTARCPSAHREGWSRRCLRLAGSFHESTLNMPNVSTPFRSLVYGRKHLWRPSTGHDIYR